LILLGEWIYEIFDKVGINEKTVEDVAALIDAAVSCLSDEKYLRQRNSKLALTTLIKSLSLIFSTTDQNFVKHCYRVFVRNVKLRRTLSQLNLQHYQEAGGVSNFEKGAMSRTLSFWCFNAGVGMQQLKDCKPRCFILTSGTLSPMNAFEYELGM